jgi:uncharacterized protein GlcG (DUF336 family)
MKHHRPPLLTASLLLAAEAFAQSPPSAPTPPLYGPAIALEDARRCSAAVISEAARNQWLMVVTVVDSGGHTVLTERMDNAQFGSVRPALDKAQGAVAFRRPTKVFEDMIAQGGAALRIMALPGVLPIDGGLLLLRDGKVIGGVGVSGGTSREDGIAAAACPAALAK